MKRLIVLFIIFAHSFPSFASDLKLWYKQPAQEWTSGLPLGNGKLMSVILGGVHKEVIQLNEESLWTGGPVKRENPEALDYLPQVRKLMFEGRYAEAERIVASKMLGLRLAFGMHTYQTLGNLELNFSHGDQVSSYTDYRRELDLETAVVRVTYRMGDAVYTREVFISPVDQALVINLSCSEPEQISFDARLLRQGAQIEHIGSESLLMKGYAKSKLNAGWIGVDFESQMHIENKGGSISATKNGIRVEHADEVTIRLTAATDYRGSEPARICRERLDKAVSKDFIELRTDHIEEHQRLFSRVSLDLGNKNQYYDIPTDERLKAFADGNVDPQLISLYFQYGRYLLISSSRPGSLAVNLWGKWVNSLEPAYNADYHININIQMNYWLAEMCNLAECHEPFFDLLDSLRTRGRITARETYGCRGFVAHHATDPWYYTAAIGNPAYGMWPMAPAWMAHHLWENYLFGLDKEFLSNRSYPIMKEAAEFFLDYLVEHPKTGYMVTGPSTSPENRFISAEGKVVSLSLSPSMDNQLLYDLFSSCIEASLILDRDHEFREQLIELRTRLMPIQIGEDGRLLEWSEPFKEQNKGHRHISHLWGLCPGDLITEEKTPELFDAARKSLDVRVENGAADSPEYRGITAWVTNCYVRLYDGDQAFKHLSDIISESSWPNLFAVGVRGRDRQMFETDVNFGCTASIAEMLMQSHTGSIHILPALPASLPDGQVKGLRARGAFEIDIIWKKGKLRSVNVKSMKGLPCKIQYNGRTIEFETEPGKEYNFYEKDIHNNSERKV